MTGVPDSKRRPDLPPTPDFEIYEITARIESGKSVQDGRVLRLTWSDGRISQLHAIWLRDNASDADNLNLETREARADVTAIPPDIRIASACVDDSGAWLLPGAREERSIVFTRNKVRRRDQMRQ